MPLWTDLPDLLVAERLGRAVTEHESAQVDRPWHILADCSPLGAAAMSAARHLANRNIPITLYLTQAEAEGDHTFATLLEVCGAMDLDIRLRPGAFTSEAIHPKTTWLLGSTLPPAADLPGRRVELEHYEPADAWPTAEVRPGSAFALRPVDSSSPTLPCRQVREIDREAIEDYGLPGICLMENAGIGATTQALRMLPEGKGRVALAVGKGNNGGDALVIARGLQELNCSAELFMICNPAELRGDARIMYDLLPSSQPCRIQPTAEELAQELPKADLIVDGLLGTGLRGEVTPPYSEWIEAINAADRPVLALDIPSGLDGDRGAPQGSAVRAAATVTFATAKPGLLTQSGRPYCGDLLLADIGAPAELISPGESS